MTPYLMQLKGYFQYEIAIVIVLTTFSVIGESLFYILKIESIFGESRNRFLLSPLVGASAISLPLVFFAHHEIPISNFAVWIVIAILALPLTVNVLKQIWMKEFTFSSSSLNWRGWSVLPVAAGIGLIPYLQLLIKPGFPIGFGTSATWTNNDLGAYIQMATNVAKSGVRDAGLVTGWNAGFQASFDHPSAHSFFAGVSGILNREPYQVGIVLMATVVAMIFLGAAFVIRHFSELNSYSLLLIAAVAVVNPPIVAAVCNFFFPQLLSLSIVGGFWGLALVIHRSNSKTWASLLLAIMSISVFFISVEIAVMMIPLVSVLALVDSPRDTWNQLILKIGGAHFVVFLIVIFFESDLFKSQFDVLTKLSASGVAGWKSNFVSPSMIFGLVPNQFGGPYTSGTRVLDAIILFAIFAVCIHKATQDKRKLVLSSALISLIGLIFLATKKWGIDGYQTWKLVTTLSPVFMILLGSLLLGRKNLNKSIFAIGIAVFTLGATFSWSGSIWKDGQPSSYINQDLAQLLRLERTGSQTGLNVLLAPFFETMASSVISGAPTRMSSPNYYFFEGQEILYRCTVTTLDKLSLLPEHGPVVARRGQYVLVGTPACD